MALTQPSLNAVPFATSGSKNTIPTAPAGGGAASMTQGFPPETMQPLNSGGIPPSGQDMNGILNQLSQHQVWLNAGGLYKFDSALSTTIGGYAKGAVILLDDESSSYISTVNGNNNNPNVNLTGWKPYGGKVFEDIKVNDVFITFNNFADSAAVAAHKGYGTWERAAEGQFIVGAGTHTDTRGEEKTFAIGATGGEYRHVQTEDELAGHKHSQNGVFNKFSAIAQDVVDGGFATDGDGSGVTSLSPGGEDGLEYDTQLMVADISTANQGLMEEQEVGEGEPMNITPPYLAMAIWKRTT